MAAYKGLVRGRLRSQRTGRAPKRSRQRRPPTGMPPRVLALCGRLGVKMVRAKEKMTDMLSNEDSGSAARPRPPRQSWRKQLKLWHDQA